MAGVEPDELVELVELLSDDEEGDAAGVAAELPLSPDDEEPPASEAAVDAALFDEPPRLSVL